MENEPNSSRFDGTERLLASMNDRSCICDSSISTSLVVDLVVVFETSSVIAASLAFPPFVALISGRLEHENRRYEKGLLAQFFVQNAEPEEGQQIILRVAEKSFSRKYFYCFTW